MNTLLIADYATSSRVKVLFVYSSLCVECLSNFVCSGRFHINFLQDTCSTMQCLERTVMDTLCFDLSNFKFMDATILLLEKKKG